MAKSVAGSRRSRYETSAEAQFQSSAYFETDSSETEELDDQLPTQAAGLTSPTVESRPAAAPECGPKTCSAQLDVELKKPPRQVVPAVHVPVHRSEQVEKQRLQLPVVAEEQVIVEAIRECPVVIICGETGSGKTTQVPQFLYEAGMAEGGRLIAITEPRRVAAISMSHRVADEMNLSGDVVSYQIRFEGNVTEKTKVKFMTDGVLLKEIQSDFLLSRYSVVIIDEAHERSVYSDILIGLLSRIINLRQKRNDKLHLVIMSATLRIDDFTGAHLFKSPPRVVQVDSRQYPVTVYFNRHTLDNYLLTAYRKVCQIHRQLPAGTILVFLPGQQEVHTLLSWLKRTFPLNCKSGPGSRRALGKPVNLDDYALEDNGCHAGVDVNDFDAPDLDIFDVEQFDDLEQHALPVVVDEPLLCLPLYSLMAGEKQARVFQESADKCRRCVISTNVAETSVTIPNVRYVVDCGKEKVRLYDPVTGISKFNVQWISKASANQRAGRAGRVAPGHCYRLYSSAVYGEFEKFSKPELLTKPVDDLVLQMKAMSIVKVSNFPFPTAMDEQTLRSAEERLGKLQLLQTTLDVHQAQVSKITDLGRTVALFPVAPRYGKILTLACQRGLLAYALWIVSALSVRELLINPASIQCESKDERREKIGKCLKFRKSLAGKGQPLLLGDLMVLLKAVLQCQREVDAAVCESYGLRYKAMVEVQKMHRQLSSVINSLLPDAKLNLVDALGSPTEEQVALLRQLMLTGLCENVARRADDCVGVACKPSRMAYRSAMIKDMLWIHPTSVLCNLQPEWVAYQEVLESGGKKCMLNVMAIESSWLPLFASGYCAYGEPLADPPPFYHAEKDAIYGYADCSYGMAAWPLPRAEVLLSVDIKYYRYFATELLEGRVMKKLFPYRTFLTTPPGVLFKPWAKLQAKTDSLLSALCAESVTTKAQLVNVWRENANFLCQEYLQWIAQSKHSEVVLLWPPLDD